MSKDIGTYHLKVEFKNERGYLQRWGTGKWYTEGDSEVSPLNASLIRPLYECEDDLIESILFQYLENNYSCDCNRRLFIARAHKEEESWATACTEDIELERLTLIRPDSTAKVIFEETRG